MEIVGVAEGATPKGAKAVDLVAEPEAILETFGCSQDTTVVIPGIVNQFSQSDPRRPTSILRAAGSLAFSVGPSVAGG